MSESSRDESIKDEEFTDMEEAEGLEQESNKQLNVAPVTPLFEEFSIQLAQRIAVPLSGGTEREDGSDGKSEKPDSTSLGCSGRSCWSFDCEKTPLDTFGCNNGEDGPNGTRGSKDQRDNAKLTNSDLDVLQSVSEDLITPTSLDFIRNDASYITPGPNPIRIPHDEIMNAMIGFNNMFLAHEISINDEFQLENFMPKENSIEARSKIQMKKAFWDIFEQTFKAVPPNYKQAISILREIKKELLELLLPHNHLMRRRIIETLDIDHMEKQIQQCAFDAKEFKRYSDFVIEVLSRLCCPSRDPDVNALRQLHSGAKIFRGILETIDKMKMDMANFLVMQCRPAIIKQCVHYERTKVAEFLELEYRLNDDGLKATRLWLMRHKAENRDTWGILSKALSELLNYNTSFQWPETLTMDAGRLREMSLQLKRLAIIGTCVLSVGSIYQVMFGAKFVSDLRDKSKKHLKLIITIEDMREEAKLNEAMLRIAEEMCFLVNQFIQGQLSRRITDVEKDEIRSCVIEISSPGHKILNLILRRIYEYVDEVSAAKKQYPTGMPPGLAIIQQEVLGTISQYYRLINHNRRVFGEIYFGIIEETMRPPKYPSQLNEQWDPDFCLLLKRLRDDFVEEAEDERIRNEDIRRVQQARAELPDGIS